MERVNFIILVLIVLHIVVPFIQGFYDAILDRPQPQNNNDTFVDIVLFKIYFVCNVIIVNEIIPYVHRFFEVRL
jgi:hypothetical protein